MQQQNKSKTAPVDLLFSADDEVVIAAIELLAEKGSKDAINPLLEVLLNSSAKVQRAIESLLFQIKDQQAVEVLVAALENPKFTPVRTTILASFWNSGHLPKGHINLLCRIAAEGSFDETLEVLTIVENMDGPLEPAKLEEGIVFVSKSINENFEESRTVLLKSLFDELIKFRQ